MTLKQAIEKAIEGGWEMGLIGNDFSLSFTSVKENKASYTIKKNDGYTFYEDVPVEKIILDPQFWQALGKAMEVECKGNKKLFVITNIQSGDEGKPFSLCKKHFDSWEAKNRVLWRIIGEKTDEHCNFEKDWDWLREWHRLIDHLVEGGSIEELFEKLL